MKSSMLWGLLSCCLWRVSYVMMMTVVSDVSGVQIGPTSIVCPDDHDCVVNCSPYTRNCYNKRIICPGTNSTGNFTSNSSLSLTYDCTIECNSSVACVGTVIEAGSAVSTLTFWSYSTHASENVAIITNGTDQVLITCGEAACLNVNVTSNNASLVSLISVASAGNDQDSGFYGGMFNITNTQNVMLYCDTWGCANSRLAIDTVKNFHLECVNAWGCAGNYLQIKDTDSVLIEAIMPQYDIYHQYAFFYNHVNISNVETVILNITNGSASGWISLMNIENFLYKTGLTVTSLITWNAQNISNVAMNSWDATSFWIVDGSPIQKQYICPNGRDCNIRVDADLTATDLSSISVLCPMDSISHSRTTCQFYCSSTASSCGIVDLRARDVTNVALYFSNPASFYRPFSLNASAWDLTDVNTTLSITCGSSQGCMGDTFIVSGYADINIVLSYESGQNAIFNVSGFSQMMMLSNQLGLANATLLLTDGNFVHLLSNSKASASYQASHWKFSNIERVEIDCLQTSDCAYASFDSVAVGQVSVMCNNPYGTQSSVCMNTIFNNSEDTSFNMTCTGNYDACDSLIIQYNGSNPDKTSFELSCYLCHVVSTVTCQNISILVTDNKIGYDAITFFCQASSEYYSACEDITVSCGTDGIMCHCPVTYSDDEEGWYCDGECGSVSCSAGDDEDKDDNKLSKYAIGGIALGSLIVIIGIAVCIKRKFCKKKSYERLLDTAPQRYTT